MKDDVLIRSTMKTADLGWVMGLGVVVALVGVLLIGVSKVLAAVLVLVGLGCSVCAGFARARRIRLRQWARDSESGFVVFDLHGNDRAFQDDQVLSMAVFHEKEHSNGLLTHIKRRLVLWLVSNDPLPEKLEMTTTYAAESSDPLGGLLSRLGDKLYQRAVAELRQGRPVLGEGWSLSQAELAIRQGGREDFSPLADLAALDRVDNHLCIWRRGQDETWAKLRMDSANVHLLGRFIDEELSRRTEESEPTGDGYLGRIIFERAGSKATARSLNVAGAVLLAVTLVLAVLSFKNPPMWIATIGALACSIICGVGSVHTRRNSFRCHQYGVFRSTMFGETTLRYRDIEAFTFGATRVFVNGAYTGTTFAMTFEPLPGTEQAKIDYGVSLPHADEELDRLRDEVSRMIASRMAQRLAAGESVPWTPQLRFQASGIEYAPSGGFFSKQPPVFIPYRDIVHWELQEGYFHLWLRGQEKSLVQEAISSRNFFPGFFLLLSMAEPAEGEEAGPGKP